jgi:hypothetical protein
MKEWYHHVKKLVQGHITKTEQPEFKHSQSWKPYLNNEPF